MTRSTVLGVDGPTLDEDRVRLPIGSQRDLRGLPRTGDDEKADRQQCEQVATHRDSEKGKSSSTDHTDKMGMDPTRPHRRRPTDFLYVGAGLLVAALLVVWAIFG